MEFAVAHMFILQMNDFGCNEILTIIKLIRSGTHVCVCVCVCYLGASYNLIINKQQTYLIGMFPALTVNFDKMLYLSIKSLNQIKVTYLATILIY